MNAVAAMVDALEQAPPPAAALDGPAVARLAADSGALAALRAGGEPTALVELACALGAIGAANLLIPHVVLPALLAPGTAVDGTATVALGEGADDLDLDAVACRFEGGALSGAKPLVSAAAGFARHALIAAVAAEGTVLVDAPLAGDGVAVSPLRTIGRGGDADLVFTAVEIAPEAVVAGAGALAERLAEALPTIALVQAAEGRGMLEAMLALAVAHGNEREAFGRPIGSFQAFQHACADIAMDVELVAAMVDHGAAAPSRAGALRARLFVAEAVVAGSRAALQLQGGAGFLDEHPVSRLYRQAKESQLRWGSLERRQDEVWADEMARGEGRER
ncbi:MAG TPA: acyl-CoA dehydrogenase family protein [Solirubrobacterales bacterium]|nr:acyl-CoA dehydrogenase family protein [Solirubrobacterales bacterium]